MPLKGLDLFVCLELATSRRTDWTYSELGGELGLSASEANAAVKRSLAAGLLTPPLGPKTKPGPHPRALLEFIRHGVQYAFHEEPGNIVRGMPTAHSALPLSAEIASDGEPPVVWPDAEGEVRGQAFRPLYRTVPHAARRDQELYRALALVDAIRGGRTRERRIAYELLVDQLSPIRGR